MALNINDIRNKLKAQQDKKENRNFGGDSAAYAFWNIPNGSSATIRFLPDNNPENDFFWQERLIINLPFQGVKGESDRETIVKVPCLEMWGETDPILAETRPWWKDEDLIPLARKYWKKKSYVFQGFVTNNPMEEQNVPENPIRRFTINPSIFDIIKASLMDPDMEDLPIDYVNGRDFKLAKTTKGDYANYTSSSWSIRSRSLTETELEAINKYGLFNLKDFIPKKPSKEEIEAIKDMFHASVNGDAYDTDKFGKFYKPSGFQSNFSSTPTVTATELNEEVVVESPKVTVPSGANDALAALRKAVQPKVEEPVVEESHTPPTLSIVPSSEKKALTTEQLLEQIRARKK